MPRIPLPSVQQTTSQAGQFSAPGVVPFQDTTGQQLQQAGQAMQQSGAQVSAMAAELQDQYDEARAKEADLALAYDVDTHVGGYLQSVGKDATGDARQKALDAVQERRRSIEAGLGNDMQRRMFRQAADSRLLRASSVSGAHEARQTRVFAGSQAAARAEAAGREAFDALMANDMEGFQDKKGLMLREVDAAATITGAGDDEKANLRLGATTQLHASIVKKLVDGGHATPARDYLEGAKDEIAPEARTQLEGLVKNATRDEEAFHAANYYANRYPGDLLAQVDGIRGEALREKDPLAVEIVDRAIARLEKDAARRNEETYRVKRDVLTEAQDWIRAGNQLTPEMRENLKRTNQQWKLDAWEEANGASHTSDYGRRAWLTVSDDELLAMGSPEAVFDHYNTEVDTPKLEYLMSRYRQAAAARGQAVARTAEQEQKDVYAVDFRNEALFQFRRLAEVPDGWALSDRKEDAVMRSRFETFERNLKLQAEQLAKDRKEAYPRRQTINDAGDQIIRSTTYVDDGGKPRSVSTMTNEQVQRAMVRITPEVAKETGQEFFDMNQAPPEAMKAVRDELKKELNGVEPDEQLIWDRLAKKYADANVTRYDSQLAAVQRGVHLLFDRYTQSKNDPAMVQKAWKLANSRHGGYGSAGGRVDPWTGKLIQPTKAEMDRAMAELLMDEFGWKLADAYGVSRDVAFDVLSGERDSDGWRYDNGMTQEQKDAMRRIQRHYGTGGVTK